MADNPLAGFVPPEFLKGLATHLFSNPQFQQQLAAFIAAMIIDAINAAVQAHQQQQNTTEDRTAARV